MSFRLLSLGAFISVACALGARAQADPLIQARRLLHHRVATTHLHEELLPRYGLQAGDVTLEEIDGQRYTVELVELELGDFEEWPPIMGDAAFLLQPDRYRSICDFCLNLTRAEPPTSTIQRVLLQQELWTAFDHLYLHYAHPESKGNTASEPTVKLLWNLAQAVRHLATTPDELAGLPSADDLMAALIDVSKGVELYSFEEPAMHDPANYFRRVTRLLYFDPQQDLAGAGEERWRQWLGHGFDLSAGGQAVILENAVAVTPEGRLIATEIPVLVRRYEVLDDTEQGRRFQFSMYRLRDGVDDFGPDSLVMFPQEAEAWAFLDLPNIPTDSAVAYRVPYELSCEQCHGQRVLGLSPSMRQRSGAHLQALSLKSNPVSRDRGDLITNRVRDIKKWSAELAALRYYMSASEPNFELEVRETEVESAVNEGETDSGQQVVLDSVSEKALVARSVMLLMLGFAAGILVSRNKKRGR